MADLVTLAEALTYLGWAGDVNGFLAQTIPEVSATIESWCPGVAFGAAVEATEIYDGGAEQLVLRRLPVTAIAEVKDMADDSVLSEVIDYDFDPESGLLYLRTDTLIASAVGSHSGAVYWGLGRRRWSVKYSAGRTAVPADVKLATLEVLAMNAARRDLSVTQMSLGDLSVGYGDQAVARAVGASGLPLMTETKLARYHVQGSMF